MYLEKTLSADEKILQVAKLHWIRYIFAYFMIILGICTAIIGIGIVLFAIGMFYYLQSAKTEMVITNKRVIIKRGIIAVHTSEIRNTKVEGVRLHQSIMGRILGYGNIVFTGTGNAVTVFEDVESPTVTKTLCEETIENNK